MISEARIDEVISAVEDAGLSESLLGELRQRFAGLHLTYCMDDDVCGPEPVRAARGFNLYLVDGREHCLQFTCDPARASGLVLAEVVEDDG